MDLRTDNGPVGRTGQKRRAKPVKKNQNSRTRRLQRWFNRLELPQWQLPTMNISLPSAELGLSGVLQAGLIALWHIPDRFTWFGPVSPFHRRWMTVSVLVILLGILLPSGDSTSRGPSATSVDENRALSGADTNDGQPVTLTPEALSAREPDRRIPQEMPEELERQTEVEPVIPPARNNGNNTAAINSANRTPAAERPITERPKSTVTAPPARNTSSEKTVVADKPAVKPAPVTKQPVKEAAKEVVKTTPPPAATSNSTGWKSYQVGKGVTLAQVFRSGNLPLPDLMAMTRAQAADKPLSNVKAGQTVRVKTNAQGDVDALQIDALAGGKPVIFVRTAAGFVQSQ
ncbi:MAG: LysM-like peptidoglycan-binding domain-containing protein [Plesiomonas sp.]|uniref:LysM-like peptidoglycan-binding domain-containing protein n=1 Tax=Plesiomonas sp. TaxID=2486279 RepID=UPI003F3C91F7